MSGHVFHPGHHELHGVTVVLETRGPVTYLGRFDSQDDRGVHLLNVAIHDPSKGSREEYLRRSARFGIQVERQQVTVPAADVVRITPLGEIET
jgi:hypothetical protein